MTPPLPKTPATLLIDDLGAGLYLETGQLLGRMPEAEPGPERRAAWGSSLREWVAPGTDIQLILAHAGLLLQCQDAPFLNPTEARDVAVRVFAAEAGGGNLRSAAALDADALADGGHVLWLAAHPAAEMTDWLGAIQGAGCVPVYALPFQRALLQGLDSLWELPQDRIVLAVDLGREGHLCIFHGRSLSLLRSFKLPVADAEAEELIFEEVSRLLQFFKQKNRQMAFKAIHILGLAELSGPFQTRIQGALRLEAVLLDAEVWPVLQEGLRKERGRKDGLNLLPLEIQEAGRRKVFRSLVWVASAILGVLFLGASSVLFTQELLLAGEVSRAEKLLADREAHTAEEERTVQARLPLLRVKLAEQRQGQAVAAMARLGSAIFEPPQGIQLEKVELLEVPGTPGVHTFKVTGLAFTERSFSVGPLAQYLIALSRQPGVALEPVSELSISDRVVAGSEKAPDQLAITRFTLKGVAK